MKQTKTKPELSKIHKKSRLRRTFENSTKRKKMMALVKNIQTSA
jgi:hypothetical protein